MIVCAVEQRGERRWRSRGNAQRSTCLQLRVWAGQIRLRLMAQLHARAHAREMERVLAGRVRVGVFFLLFLLGPQFAGHVAKDLCAWADHFTSSLGMWCGAYRWA